MQLRDYQEQLISELRKTLKQHHRCLVVLPCGAGKTVVFAQIAALSQAKSKRVLFLVHRRELLSQTVDTFHKFNIPLVDIHTIQSFVRQQQTPNYDLIIFDEAHHSSSNTWLKIINKYPNAYIIGLTATPCRLDGKPLSNVYDSLLVGVTAEYLISRGYLSEYKYYAPTVADLTKLRTRGSDYDQEHVYELLDKPVIYGNIINTYKQLSQPNTKTICYAPNIQFSKSIVERFNQSGIISAHLDANTPKSERERIISDFRGGDIRLISNVDLISEGFDVPDCDCAILLRPTKSLSLYIQQACRPLRPSPNKTHAIIIDHVTNYARFGFPTDTREWSLTSTPDSLKPSTNTNETGAFIVRVCEACFRTFKTATECPYCGHKYTETPTEIKQIQAIQLQQITQYQLQQQKLRNENFRRHIQHAVSGYKSYNQCRNRMELSEFCKLNGYTHKQFIFFCIKRGFIRGK